MSVFGRHFVENFPLPGLYVTLLVVLDPCNFGVIGWPETSVNNWKRSLRNVL